MGEHHTWIKHKGTEQVDFIRQQFKQILYLKICTQPYVVRCKINIIFIHMQIRTINQYDYKIFQNKFS